jgi:hypothetical protein
MQDTIPKEKAEPAATETVPAFDLGNIPRPSDGTGWRAATGEGGHWPDEFSSPRWGDLSRLGNGERSLAEPKARRGPSERARVSQRVRRPDEVNSISQFLHKASLPWRDEVKRRRLIPAEFAGTKTAAGRRRMWRTRLAHEAACAPQDADHVPETLDGLFRQRREHCLEPVHRPGQSRPAIHVLPHGRRGIKSFSHRFAQMKHGFF